MVITFEMKLISRLIWEKWELFQSMRISKEPSGMSRTAKNSKKRCFSKNKAVLTLSCLWTYCMSGYLREPIGDNEDLKEARRIVNGSKRVQMAKQGDFERRLQSWRTFIELMQEAQCSWIFTCQCTLLDQSETIRNSKESSGMLKGQQGPTVGCSIPNT